MTLIQKLRDKGGNALVYSTLFILFFLLIFYGIFSYVQYKSDITYIQQTAVNVLDEYTAEQGKKKEISIKNGTIYTATLDTATYTKLLADALGVDQTLAGHRQGLLAFQISNLNLTFRTGNQINSEVKFSLEVPVYIGKIPISAIRGEVVVRSKYNVVPQE